MLCYYDAHAHLHEFISSSKVENIIKTAGNAGLKVVLVNSVSGKDWELVLSLAADNKLITPFLGLHPWYIDDNSLQKIELLENYIENAICGIGEVGLDRKNNLQNFKLQLKVFEAQLSMAEIYQRPLSIHAVGSMAIIVDRLRDRINLQGQNLTFMLHSFNGSCEQAGDILDLNGYISLSPAILGKSKEKLANLLKYIPLTSLLIETDSPASRLNEYIRRQYFSGYGIDEFENSPLLLPDFYKIIADIKGVDLLEFTSTITQNIKRYLQQILR